MSVALLLASARVPYLLDREIDGRGWDAERLTVVVIDGRMYSHV